jgi:arylsulfatase A-like enzyme
MITRRQAFAAALGFPAVLRSQPRRPNVLILFTDDQRFDTVAALGYRDVRTPNMDRLVRTGTAFTRAHIMGGTIPAVCMPSRAMLLTGQTLFHAHRRTTGPEAAARANREYHLFPELFRRNGYATFGTGKWHNGPPLYARCFGEGAEIFFGGMSDHMKVPIQDFDPAGEYGKERMRTADKFSSELFSDAAVDFVRRQEGKSDPFLAYVSYTAPHDPRTAPREFEKLYPPSRVKLPANFLPEHPFDNGELKVRDELLAPFPRTPAVVREHIAAYYAMISHLDAHIGRVLDALHRSGRADNTIIVFAGDNGLAVGQHGLLGKQNLYDHSVRVPLVIAGPGIPRERRTDSLCYLLDIFPTLCDYAGLSVPATVEGLSLKPAIEEPGKRLRNSLLLAYRHFQRGITDGDWKLIKYHAGKQTMTQLFDLRTDPHEMKNLAEESSQQDRVRQMSARLANWMKRAGDELDLSKHNWGYEPKG